MSKTDDMAENQITFTKAQFIGIILSAVIGGAITGVFGAVRAINTDHYTLIAIGKQVEENKMKDDTEHKTFVTREELRDLVISRMDRMQASIEKLR